MKIQLAMINGLIDTSNHQMPICDALAITDGKFSYVGSTEQLLSMIEPSTSVIDLKGAFVMPSIIDGHCHVFANYLGKFNGVDFTQGHNQNEYLDLIAQYIRKHPDQKIIQGRGWVNSAFEKMCPTKDLLKEVQEDKILCFRSMDGHSMWVNDALLALANITMETKKVLGGRIEVDDQGQPNGCIRDAAMRYVQQVLEDFSIEQYQQAILEGQKEYAALGYGGYLEAVINENYQSNLHQAYRQLAQQGKLVLPVYSNFVILADKQAEQKIEIAKEWMKQTKGQRYQMKGIKLFMDGIVESKTACLKEPYQHEPNNFSECRFTMEQLERIFSRAQQEQIPIHVHSIGDQATERVLDVIEKTSDNRHGLRHVIAHLQLVDQKEIKRMAEHDVIALLNPWCTKEKGYFEESEVLYLGEKRANQEYLVKSFFDQQVHCSFGTDFPLDPLNHPFVCMQNFVTRQNGEDEYTCLNPSERINRQTVIDMFTYGTAYQLNLEKQKGRIVVGYDADLLILNQNLLTVDEKDIGKTKVLVNMVEGKIVYQQEGSYDAIKPK